MAATITPQEMRQKLATESPRLIDVRTPMEFRQVHVEGAENVPLDHLAADQFADCAGQLLYVICHSGSRGAKACDKLAAAGLNVVNIEGGTSACVEAGVPVVRGKKAMSLERQVRIAAGSLVVVGAVFAATVHPYWIALSGFVGAGLVFAGVTDTCGMGMLLARAPWNQVKDCGPTATKCCA